jgi:hypothetical protein
MPFKPNELDPVNDFVMQALQYIRDLAPAGVLEVEQLRTRVYQHLSAAANEIMNATFVRTMGEAVAARPKEPKAPGQVRTKPASARQALLDAFQEELRKDLEV